MGPLLTQMKTPRRIDSDHSRAGQLL